MLNKQLNLIACGKVPVKSSKMLRLKYETFEKSPIHLVPCLVSSLKKRKRCLFSTGIKFLKSDKNIKVFR